MKKKILICQNKMVIGGIESALINLLKRIDPNQFEVDLLLESKGGEFFKYIPSFVNVFDSESIGLNCSTKVVIRNQLKRLKLFSASKTLYYWLKKDLRRFDSFYGELPNLKYDVAICFSMQSLVLMKLVNDHVNAPIKIGFVHGVPANQGNAPGTVNINERSKYMSQYTHIFGVSKAVTDKMIELFPQYKDKCNTMYNFIDVAGIIQKADENMASEMQTDKIKILSVGRFTEEKNFKIIPSVCKELDNRNIDFTWYIIGDGKDRNEFQNEIDKEGLNCKLILLGAKENPYPYFKACEIYCQPSLLEAYCITLCEARIFGKPTVATDFYGAREQLSDGKGGLIADCNAQDIAKCIIRILEMSNDEKQKMLEVSTYPNKLERTSEKYFFEIIGQQ